MLRRCLAAVTAVTLLVGSAAVLSAPAGAARKASFQLSVYNQDNTVAQGEPLQVLGSLTPGHKRPYVVQERLGGSWHAIRRLRTGRTGVDSFTLTRSTTGHFVIRGVARRYQGHRKVVSNIVAWTVLTRTTLTAAWSANPAPASATVTVSGQLSPAASRPVEVIPNDPYNGPARTVMSAPDGTFAISIPTGAAGSYDYRVAVPESATEGPANFQLPTLHVS